MSVAFAAPLALAALAALVVPVALHLVRRAEHRTTPFAALRFLVAAGLPRRRVRLAEIALLLLRCALIVVLALWLARPLLQREPPVRHVVAVVPGVDAARARDEVARIAEASVTAGSTISVDAVWLAPGFPPFEGAAPVGPVPLASVLRELDARLGASSRIDVVVPDVVSGLDGERPRLSRDVGFHVVPGAEAPTEPAPPAPARRLALHAAPGNALARRYLGAAVAAWNAERAGSATLAELAADAPIPDGTSALVWLDAPLAPHAVAWIDGGGTALVAGDDTLEGGDAIADDDEGAPLVREHLRGRGRILALAAPLDPSRLPLLHEPVFARRLAQWLQPPPAPPDRAVADALRPERGALDPVPSSEPLAPWLAGLAALLAAIERVVASGLRRRSPA